MKNKIIILDTETTDVTPEPWMIQLGYIVCDLQFNELKRENLFFDTEKDIDLSAMAVHHITRKILATKLAEDKRTDEEKKTLAIEDFKDAYLVAHNSPFDKNVLDCNGIVTEGDSWIDTYGIAYELFQEDGMKHSLQYLRYFMELEFDEVIDAHDALSDVIVLKSVFHSLFWTFLDKAMKAWADLEPEEALDAMIEETKKWIILRKWMFGKYNWRTFEDTAKIDIQYLRWMFNQKKQDGKTNDALFNTLSFYINQ